MKRFTIFDGLFLILFYCKLRGLGIPTAPPSWFIVFLPYILQSLFVILGLFVGHYGWDDRARWAVYKFFLRLTLRSKRGEARKIMGQAIKNGRQSANPGQFVDPSKFGK